MHRVSVPALRSFLEALARAAPRTRATEVTLLLAGDAAVRRLNRAHRGKDRTTDVLSFPSDGRRAQDGSVPLGDIVISVPQAARQARAARHSLAREVRVLAIHGYLHLLGYDHEVDGGTMMRLQSRLVRALLP
ncbi:MAG TPA: rRNA maturation RNase YbeY [Candidatus Sulfotelmatobacter sp.]|nr:rRNA maturation RNase YbeY [Candidatus Sulfotelmatobacter sp.]